MERLHARERRAEDLDILLGAGWPAFIGADKQAERALPSIRARFSELELVVLDQDDVPVAAGWAVPIRWDGTVEDLPTGYSDTLDRALVTGNPNTLVICAAQVHPARRKTGLAETLLNAFRDTSAERGDAHVIVPLRPTLKARYPLVPIDVYASWTRSDGTAFDPWLRAHLRMGARVLSTAPNSQVMTGTVQEWERLTGMAFPDSRDYVIPDGLSLLRIDTEQGVGEYREPNIWVQHR